MSARATWAQLALDAARRACAAPVLRAVGDGDELGQGLDAVRAVRERLNGDDGEST